MGRFHGYVPKMHPIYLCAGTASHIGDFSDYACYVAVLFLPDRVSVMKLQKRGVVRISDTTFLRSRHTGRRNMLRTGTCCAPELHTKAVSTNDRTTTDPFML